MKIAAVLANGSGNRFESEIPKQFHKVNGKMVLDYVIDALAASSADKIVIATDEYSYSQYFTEIKNLEKVEIIKGGQTRNLSLKKVLDYINENYKCDKLIVCDAVRPLITPELISSYFDLLNENDAVVTAQKITDSLGCYDFQKVDRERYYLMQSPEGFNFRMLYNCFDPDSKLTEVTQQFPENSKIKLCFDFKNNFKLTYPEDMVYLKTLLDNKQ